jgi:hypothetical protein
MDTSAYLKSHIRTVPDWPAPGVQFRDITPLLQDPKVFRVLVDAFVHRYMDPALRPDVVAGLDARGFIIGSVLAYELGVGFVPIRKKGKLPFTTVEETYELEYGSATVELHTDAVKAGRQGGADRRPDRHRRHHDGRHAPAGEAGRRGDRRRRHCGPARTGRLSQTAQRRPATVHPRRLRRPLEH